MDFEEQHGFEYLPMEILIEIYRYLSFDDIQSASQTCHQWFEASQYDEFHSKLILKFTKIILSDLIGPAEYFTRSFRTYPNLYLEDIKMEDCQLFLSNIGEFVESITFDSVDFTSKQFCTILENMISLKEIIITETCNILDDNNFLLNLNDKNRIRQNLLNLSSLCISTSTPEIESIQRLCVLCPELEKLHINFRCSLHLNDTTRISNVLRHIIENNSTTLKDLSLKHVVDTGELLPSITIFTGFYLEKLRCIDITPWRSLLIFCTTQNHLIELDLSNTEQITDANIRLITKFCSKLESIKLANCTRLSDSSLEAISTNLVNLKVLNISNCDRLTSYGIKEAIAVKINKKFEELYLAGLELHPSCIIKICKNLRNLKILDVSKCMGISNCTVQRIIIDLINLKSLNLEKCKLISDYALTGLNYETQEEDGFSISRLCHLQYLNLKGCKLITDVSFIKSIKLLELKRLCLPNIAICASDIKMLAKNCPSIVNLDLSECQTMDNVDKVMDSFKDFRRLKYFQFSEFQISISPDKI